MEDYRLSQTGQEVQNILNGAAMQVDLNTEVERATDAEGTLQENIDAEAQARQDADGLLQQGIDDEAQRAKDAEEANAGEIEGIKALIPSTATSANKLADTNYVNSSIQTATAEYRGDYNVVTDLHLAIDATHAQIETLLPTVIAEADKNDYCYVMIPTSAQTPTEIAKIERYKMTSEGWKFEYDVNNSTFTAEEWAAIKSGVTSGLVAKLNALPTNADLLLLLAGKQDVLTFDSVPVPESNNPVKSGGVYSAIDDEKTARLNSDTAIHAELDGLQAKVPATASSDNKLVDQNQMNSSISTATATFRGDWNVVSDLHLSVDATRAQIAALLPTVISTADNNDYCYVEIPTSAETPTQIERVERYKFNGIAWAYEYTLNNSGFTADQWAAINSMITSGLVAKLSALPTNADLLAMLAQKQDNLTFDSTPTENSTNPVTSGGVFAADKALSDAIEAILLLIPSAASSLNKLVDTSLMNSSISTATATFSGTYNLVSDLGLDIDATEGQIAAALLSAISTADNNDYAFVQIPTSAQTPTQIARTDRYKFNGTAWAFEYTLNTSGFTAAQWAAINSTITSALVVKLNALPTAAELQEVLGTLTSGITAINQKIPSTASQANKLVDNASMESYIAQVINILDASFNVTSTDGHITLHITQVDGVITSVQVQGSNIASTADLALKASQADLTALASRVSTAEGNITSLTGRMGTAETNISNLQQLYNDLQQSKPVPVTALPSTGQQQGVIYRLAGTTSYSDYMWNGSSWVLMATYNNAIDPRPKKASQNLVTSGGVFDNMGALDVSELNATENPHTLAQYTDLSAALADISTDYKKGGMSIKFIQGNAQSSDNKYVQARLMAQNFTTDVTQWQSVDDVPTAGSEDLVKSSGVELDVNSLLSTEIGFLKTEIKGYLDGSNKIVFYENSTFNIVRVKAGDIITFNKIKTGSAIMLLQSLPVGAYPLTPVFSSGTALTVLTEGQSITIPSDTNYVLLRASNRDNTYTYLPDEILYNGILLNKPIIEKVVVLDGWSDLYFDALSHTVIGTYKGHVNGNNALVEYGESSFACVAVNPGDILEIRPSSYCAIIIAKTFDKDYVLPYSVDVATGGSFADVTTNTQITIPSDGHYLLVRASNNSGVNILPEIYVNGCYILESTTNGIGRLNNTVPVTLTNSLEYKGWVNSTDNIVSWGDATYKVLKLNGEKSVTFVRSEISQTRPVLFMVLKSFIYNNTLPYNHLDFATGFNGTQQASRYTPHTFQLPSDAQYIVIGWKDSEGNLIAPKNMIVNGYDYISGVKGLAQTLQNVVDIAIPRFDYNGVKVNKAHRNMMLWSQGAAYIGNNIALGFNASHDGDPTNYAYANVVDVNTATITKTLNHNLGHVNGADYNSDMDYLVTTMSTNRQTGISHDCEILLLNNILNKIEESANLEYQDCVKIPLGTLKGDYTVLCCFGETNNIVYIGTIEDADHYNAKDGRWVYKIFLGMGENDLSSNGYGTFISGKSDNEYNGTAILLDIFAYNDFMEIQGGKYVNGRLIVPSDIYYNGIVNAYLTELTFDDEKKIGVITKRTWIPVYTGTGDKESVVESEDLIVVNNSVCHQVIIHGESNLGMVLNYSLI